MRSFVFYLWVIAFIFGFLTKGSSQNKYVTISGIVKDKADKSIFPFANVVLKTEKDSTFVIGVITNDEGRYVLTNIKPNSYYIETSFVGYSTRRQPLFVGSLSDYLEVPPIELEEQTTTLQEVIINGAQDDVSGKMDKKTFFAAENISQSGGSVLQMMQNLPGITVQDGKVQLRGNDKVIILIDGYQTALTGMGSQSGLDNLPASSIDRIEIINNPSAKYDANGNAGIINIVYKKNKREGLNGRIGIAAGLGSLWIRRLNLSTIRPQYQFTPKINPSFAINYRKDKVNLYLQSDYLFTKTLNKNEFTVKTFDAGTIINQQLKRNRNTQFSTTKMGVDWNIDAQNTFSVSGLYGTEKIIDHGDEPFFNADLTQRLRLWQFLEDELKTTAMGMAAYQHKFKQPGHLLNAGFNYTFHREDEKYFFDNILPSYTGKDAFKLISDEHVADFNLDYTRPLTYGHIEGGVKFRWRDIPTNMLFLPGLHSPLDSTAGGPATYKEVIPALYSNYIYESKRIEAEIGLRIEYVSINYVVGLDHPVYKSDEYNYTQPFPSIRFAYKINDMNKLAFFYSRRVDRPNEVDIRIFPKYDDAEIIKVGNPALRPQFTNTFELGYKTIWQKGYIFGAAYQKSVNGTITRIASTIPGSTLIYNVFQNADQSYQKGLEFILSQEFSKWYAFNLNLNGYHNTIDAFTVENKYPVTSTFTVDKQEVYSGNAKINNVFHLPNSLDLQVTFVYLAPDIIPQGKVGQRFSIDLGVKTSIHNGRGELFLNATDLAHTMVVKKEIQGNGFKYVSSDYNETQVVRVGYNYKF